MYLVTLWLLGLMIGKIGYGRGQSHRISCLKQKVLLLIIWSKGKLLWKFHWIDLLKKNNLARLGESSNI